MSGSVSSSDSGSFSSTEAIIAHFDEAAATLEEAGFPVTQHAFDSITRAIKEETINEISFWGMSKTTGHSQSQLFIKIDWATHRVVVAGGDEVVLPVKDGRPNLRKVERMAKGFMRAVAEKDLRGVIRLRYCPKDEARSDELDRRYGWTSKDAIERSSDGFTTDDEGRYHPGVDYGTWHGD